ncbi:MAG: hypothetical protein WHT08_07115 [Bryobacteraceae bacterium]
MAASLPLEPASPPGGCAGEAARIETLIAQLTELKSRLAETEAQLDALLRTLSEQKGAVANPPRFDALQQPAEPAAGAPDRKPAVVRCAAITASGNRCTRPAAPGSRYCRQHQLAHQK